MKRIFVTVLCVCLLAESLVAENVDITNKKMRLFINEKIGTFTIYAIDTIGKQTPVFDGQGSAADITAFYLKTKDKVYRLRNEGAVKAKASPTQVGAAITYTVKDIAEVVVEFSFIETSDSQLDAVRIDVQVKNLAKGQQSFSIKGLFDTALGERDASFFSTVAQTGITSEYLISDMEKHQWIEVADTGNALRFLLDGPGITTPHSAVFANKDVLNTPAWDAGCYNGRSFTSITSNNNAAVDIRWNQVQLQNAATGTVTFYISVAARYQPAMAEFYPATSPFGIRDVTTPTVESKMLPQPQPVTPFPSAPVYAPQYQVAPAPVYTPQSAPMYAPQYQVVPNPVYATPVPTPPVYTAPMPQATYPQRAYPQNGYPQSAYPPAQPYTSPVPQSAYPPVVAYDAPPVYQYPAQPVYPTQPTYPAQPVYPTQPTYPTQPAYPTQPPVIDSSKPLIDMDYATDLYDRILKLSSTPGGINGTNRDEIIRLSGELDAFMNQIKRK